MLDFLKINYKNGKKSSQIYPSFLIGNTTDLMIRGGDFYAIWDEQNKVWSTSEIRAVELMDKELRSYYKEHKDDFPETVQIMYMSDGDSGSIDRFHKYVQKQQRDNFHALDSSLIFSNTEITKECYCTRKLPYPLKEGSHEAYDRLIDTLYDPDERHKIEWAIGAVVSGDSKEIQKFLVLYGAAGTGKSTVLNIIQELFDGYCAVFDAKSLGSSSDAFALEAFKNNPLVGIQHDGDLSRIEDNTRINSLTSHETMMINAKYTKRYEMKFHTFLFMGTNKPVRITDAKSGILRRLIDVSPSGRKLSKQLYFKTMSQIKFELGAIAYHCLKVYEEDKNYYDDYVPVNMLGASNDFYNFILDSYETFSMSDEITLKSAWENYKQYCDDAKVSYPYPLRAFKEELKNYYREFKERAVTSTGERVRNLYSGFIKNKFNYEVREYQDVKNIKVERSKSLKFEDEVSILDDICKDCKAQYGNDEELPQFKWDEVTTKLSDLDTHKIHYVRLPKNHIVIDFDLKDKDGNKSATKNLEAASKWPETYGEFSKSGAGVHLHYFYDGDVTKLSRIYADNIEVKVFTGKSSLRRKLTKCNNKPIATLNSGLPLKGEDKVVNFDAIQSEKGLRTLIRKCLNKEHHGATKPEIDFIFKILNDSYASGLKYDVSDMRAAIIAFAAGSSHKPGYCLNLVNNMKFKSDEPSSASEAHSCDDIIFFDVEVMKNLFVVVWKARGGEPIKMINPSPAEIETILKFKLVGFNNRRYDNHILYARLLGYTNEQLFNISQKIINGSKDAFFGEAYNLSYTDIYDFSSKKQSLKKFEIELGIHHQELGLPWDQPVPENLWPKVAEYCANDVIATEAVFNARKEDFVARQILADIAGLSVNDTTNTLTTTIIFGKDKRPQDKFVYTDLSTIFPGYKFENGKSSYRGEDPGEGGYVYAEPGIYENVALLDVASMHPTSIEQLNLFGPYTKNFSDIKRARILIKHKDFNEAKKMFDGKLSKYLEDESLASALSYALKIAINSVYGLTSAKFDNKCKDPRNVDNIVAKRGALFMIDLKHAIQEKGFTVAHIKTDSIKIPNPTPEIIDFVMEFGKRYGYIFEHEATYDRMCLVNDAVYIAKYKDGEHKFELSTGEKIVTPWTATGTQFQIPYVFKKLFAKKDIIFADLCETKSVTSSLYLDMNEENPEEHNYIFVGKVGQFCPIKKGCGGGLLVREKDGKYNAATGTKGFRWLESEVVKNLHKEDNIDRSYYNRLVDEAIASISEYGDFEWFTRD